MVPALQLTGHGHGDRGPGSGGRRGRLGGHRGGGGAAALITQPGQVVATGAGATGPEPSDDSHRQEVPDPQQHAGPTPEDGGQAGYPPPLSPTTPAPSPPDSPPP